MNLIENDNVMGKQTNGQTVQRSNRSKGGVVMDDRRKKKHCMGIVLLFPVMLAYVLSSVLVLRADQEYGLHTSVQSDTSRFDYTTTQILRHFLVEFLLIDSPQSPDFLLKAGLHPLALPRPTRQIAIRGDVTGNGIINIRDVLATVKHITGTRILEGRKHNCADINNDRVVDIQDVFGIVNIIIIGNSTRGKTGVGVSKPEDSFKTLAFLESLEPYLRFKDYAKLMVLVREGTGFYEGKHSKLTIDRKHSEGREEDRLNTFSEKE